MREKIERLINVKSIVTLTLTAVFSGLSIGGQLSVEQFQSIFTTVIAFYFGTQSAKKEDNK